MSILNYGLACSMLTD